MNCHDLTVTLQNSSSSADSYWLRLEQEGLPNEAATVSDAAALLNALYDINPCSPEETTVPVEETPKEPAVPVDAFAALVAGTLDFVDCSIAPDGNVDVTLRVIRSHQGEPYRLNLQGGRVKQTVVVSAEITRSLEISAATVLDYPLLGTLTANIQPESIDGNTLTFAEYHVGRTLIATYLTSYDQVTLTILGVDGEPGACTALGFYHGMVEELAMEIPEPVDIDPDWCSEHNIHGEVDQVKHTVTCFETVVYSKRCSCSRDEVDWGIYDRVVDCPDNIVRCPNNLTECNHYVGTVQELEYVECTNDTTYAARPDFYEGVCCEPPGVKLPPCLHQRLTHKGGHPVQEGEEYYLQTYGPNTVFHPIPPVGDCGDWYIDQEYRGCTPCAGVPALVWDTENSVGVLADNSSGMIAVLSAVRPVVFTIEGTGFFFDSAHKKTRITSLDGVAWVHTGNACGAATIIADDGCSTVEGVVFSPDGQWVVVGSWNPVSTYFLGGVRDFFTYESSGAFKRETYTGPVYSGKYRQTSTGQYIPGSYDWAWHTWYLPRMSACSDHSGERVLDPLVRRFHFEPFRVESLSWPEQCGGSLFYIHYGALTIPTIEAWEC
jgi:hypothetical protein